MKTYVTTIIYCALSFGVTFCWPFAEKILEWEYKSTVEMYRVECDKVQYHVSGILTCFDKLQRQNIELDQAYSESLQTGNLLYIKQEKSVKKMVDDVISKANSISVKKRENEAFSVLTKRVCNALIERRKAIHTRARGSVPLNLKKYRIFAHNFLEEYRE